MIDQPRFAGAITRFSSALARRATRRSQSTVADRSTNSYPHRGQQTVPHAWFSGQPPQWAAPSSKSYPQSGQS